MGHPVFYDRENHEKIQQRLAEKSTPVRLIIPDDSDSIGYTWQQFHGEEIVKSGYSLLFAFFLASLARAEPEADLASMKAFSATGDQLDQYLEAHVPEPLASLTTIRSRSRITLDEDGRYDVYTNTLLLVENEAGLAALGQLIFQYRPWFESRPEIRTRVYTRRQFHELDPSTMVESSINQSGLVYSDTKIVHVPLEKLQVGSFVELEVLQRQHQTSFEGGVNILLPLSVSVPTGLQVIDLDLPSGDNIRYGIEGRYEGKSGLTEMVDNGRRRVTFQATDVKPLPPSLNLRIPDQIVDPVLVVSTGKSWNAVARSYAKLVDVKAAELGRERVHDLIQSDLGRQAVIRSVMDYVNRNIRYTANDLGQSTLVPDSPLDVLDRQYGDCKDQSTLMVSMLRNLGIEASVVLLSTSQNGLVPEGYPGINAFNHTIVYLPEDEIWIDPASMISESGRIPQADQGRLSLIADASSRTLLRTPIEPADRNRQERVVDIYYQDDAGARVVDVRSFTGVLYDEITPLEGARKEQLRKQLEGLSTTVLGGVAGNFEVMEDEDSSVLQISAITNDAKTFKLLRDGNSLTISSEDLLGLVPIQFTPQYQSLKKQLLAVNQSTTEKFESREKETFSVGFLRTGVVTERHHVPAYMRWVNIPPAITIEGPVVRYTRTSRVDRNLMTVTTRMEVRNQVVTAEQLEIEQENYRLFMNQMKQNAKFRSVPALLLEEGKAKEAFEMHKTLVEKNPDNVMHIVRYSEDLEKIGLKAVALGLLLDAEKNFPESAILQNELGNNLLSGYFGKFHQPGSDAFRAAQHFRRAIELDPDDIYSLYGLAVSEILGLHPMGYGTDHFLEITRLIHQGLIRFRETHMDGIGEPVTKEADVLAEKIADLVWKGYFHANDGRAVMKFLKEWDFSEVDHQKILLMARILEEGVDTALSSMSGMSNEHRKAIADSAIADMIRLGAYDAMLELANAVKTDESIDALLNVAEVARRSSSCLLEKNPLERLVWQEMHHFPQGRRIDVSTYPAEVRGLASQLYVSYYEDFWRVGYETRADRDYFMCMDRTKSTQIGPFVLVRYKKKTTALFYRDSGGFYLLTDRHDPKLYARLINRLMEENRWKEARGIVNWLFTPDRQFNVGSQALIPAIELNNDVTMKEIPFFVALLQAQAEIRDNEVVRILNNPPSRYETSRARRAIRKLLLYSMPDDRKEEMLGLIQEIFDDSDQEAEDWRPFFYYYYRIDDAEGYEKKYREFTKYFGELPFRQINIQLLNNNYDAVFDLTSQMVREKVIGQGTVIDVAWQIYRRTSSPEMGLELYNLPELVKKDETVGDLQSLAILQAAAGKPLEAWETVTRYKREKEQDRKAERIVQWDYLVLALIARHLGYNDYVAELVELLSSSNNDQMQEILVFVRD